MAGQGQAPDFGRAGVKYMKENALTLLNLERLALAQHLAVDAEEVVADLIALGLFLRLDIGLPADLLQFGYRRSGEKIHRHITALAEGRLEFLKHEEEFAVVGARIVLRLDVNRPRLARVRAAIEVTFGHDMCVVEAKAGRLRREGDAPHAVRRHIRGAFFGCAVDVGWDDLAVPVHELGRIRVVEYVDRDRVPFFETQQRAGELAIIERRRNDVVGRELNKTRSNAQGHVRRSGLNRWRWGCYRRGHLH